MLRCLKTKVTCVMLFNEDYSKIYFFCRKVNEMDTKSCRICLSSNTDTILSSITSLSKFFIHVLGINEPPNKMWLCGWCQSVLRKITKLIQLAEESQSFLLNLKKGNIKQYNLNKNRSKLFNLSFYHIAHNDIEPKTKKHKAKSNKNTTNTIQFIALNEANEKAVDEVKLENDNTELNEIKIETMEMDEPNTDITEADDVNDETEEDKPKSKIDPKLHEKCEQNKFILKILTPEEQIAELKEKKTEEKYLNKRYKCEYCAIGFVTTEVFNKHMKKHEASHSSHECKICHLRLKNTLVLTQHTLAHERRYHCQICGAVICRLNDCRSHRLKCGNPTPGVCPHCKKVFSNKLYLDQHISGVHYKKEKKFVCSYCDQRFQSNQRLAIHTRTHTGAKPYSCELCQRTFASNSNLRYHRAAHGLARPYYCVECDKSYKTQKGLRRHLTQGATHSRKHVHSCHHCLKNFGSEKLLASHIASAHTKEPDASGVSYKTFSTSANLKKLGRRVEESAI